MRSLCIFSIVALLIAVPLVDANGHGGKEHDKSQVRVYFEHPGGLMPENTQMC
jgi:ABC-type transporter Mla subunit MlaD